MKGLILLLLTLLVTSCSMLATSVPVTVKERLAVGSVLQLNQEIVIPQDRMYIYIADGDVAKLKNYNTVDIYQPYCMLYLHEAVNQPHTIVPDQFKITKITEWEGYYSSLESVPRSAKKINTGLIKVGYVKTISYRESGDDIIMYATILRLYSEKQPEVRELVCGHWDKKSLVEPLTLNELKTALGNLMTIEAKVL